MSMYDLVFGSEGRARGAVLLHLLGDPDPGRFRDAWLEKGDDGKPVIVIYTRNGGGNRECFCDDDSLGLCTGCLGDLFEDHELCFKAVDDEFDTTYRSYYFHLPSELPEEYEWLRDTDAQDPVDTDQRWKEAIQSIAGRPQMGAVSYWAVVRSPIDSETSYFYGARRFFTLDEAKAWVENPTKITVPDILANVYEQRWSDGDWETTDRVSWYYDVDAGWI